MTACPNSERLRSLLDGQLAAAEQVELQQHIDSCERCQQTLESLVAGQESWDGIARRLGDGGTPVTPALQEAIAAAKSTKETAYRHKAWPDCDEVPIKTLLQPSEQPDSMGRLAHYEILSEVGSGGMGVVLKAFDPSLRRVVAIKVMAPHLAANAAARRRFVREAQAAAAVAHEHVVAIHAVADQHEPPYLAMQFIEGTTLQERLDKSGPLSVCEVLRIGMQTAAGLAAAHAQGLVHRDIKPANILLENGVERVKLTDFGLARAVDDASVTQSGVIAGTPLFMSPEQARGEAVDHRSDLFSLGSVLYAMCVGHSPFRASTTMGVIKRVCDDSPRLIRDVNPDVPDWLSEIIAKLLAKVPSDRFQTAAEVADLLEQFLAHVQQPSVVARPERVAAAIERAPAASNVQPTIADHPALETPAVKRRWVIALFGLAMAVLCGGLFFPYAERIFDGRTAQLKLELAGPHVEVTLNGVKVAVTDKGEAEMYVRPGDYEVVGLKNGQFAGSSIYLLHSGIPLTADNREFDAVRVTGPRTLEYGPGSAPPTIADYTAIQGRWTIISQMKDGHPSPASQRSKWIELDYDLFRSDAPGTTPNVPNVRDTRFSINPSAEPKHIDFVGLRAKGIYRLDGHTLTLAIAEVGHPRPAAFESRYGSPVTLIVCRREASPVRPLANADPQIPVAAATAAGLSEVIRFEGHQSWVGDFDISADGTSLVTGSGIPEAMVFVWSMENGHIHRRLGGHTRSVHAVRFSPDGKRVIAAGKGGVIILWDVAKEKEIRRFEGHNCWIQTLAWSPDGKRIASGTANWHSPGGVIEVRIWNAETGELVRAIPMPVDERGKGTVLSLRFLPDGKRLLANCQMPAHGVQILDIETGQVVQRLVGGHSKVDSATLSADARFVATGRQATRVRDGVWNDPDNAVVSLWDLQTDKPKSEGMPSPGRLLHELRGHRSGVSAVSFSPDGRLLASCSGGQFLNDPIEPTAVADHSIRLWDVASGRELLRHDHATSLSKLRFTPDGRHLVTNASGVGDRPDETRLWRVPDRIIDPPVALAASPVVLEEQRRLEGHTKNITGLAFLSQGRAVSTSGDKMLRLWNVATGELLRQWDDPQGGAPLSLAVSAEERLAATGCHDGAINIWSLDAEQKFRQYSAHTKPIYDLTFTPNGRQLLSVSADETVRVWDVGLSEEVRRIESLKGPRCVAVSPDGRWVVVGCYSWQVAIFNLETAALAKELKAVGGAVLDVTFSPDGRQVAAGTQDGHVVIWDVESEAIVTRLLGHTDDVGSVAFTPDGRFVVSGGDLGVGDQTIRIREVTTGREVARIAAETHILNRFALSPDGRQLITGGGEFYRDQKWHDDGDYAIRLWPLPLFANPTTP